MKSIVKRKQSELEYELLCERANFLNLIYGGRTVNDRILKKAEDLSLKYESRQDQMSFLAGFVEGYKHLKATRVGDDAYENGRVYGADVFAAMVLRREERAFRENRPRLRRVK